MNLTEWCADVWQAMEAKGFHAGRSNSRDDILVRLCLVHTEISEAAQEVKRHWVEQGGPNLRQAVALELADAVIRICDLCGCLDIDLEAAVQDKMAINRQRPYQYGTPQEAAS